MLRQSFLREDDHEFEIVQNLGWSTLRSVNLVQHPKFGRVACRTLRHGGYGIFNSRQSIEWKKEANKLKELRHPNIVALFDTIFDDSNSIRVFLEYMKYGSVQKFLTDFKVMPEWKMQILYDVSLGMKYLHEQKPAIIHGDLTCKNILIGDGYRAKVSDFGFVQEIRKNLQRNSYFSGFVWSLPPEYLNDSSGKKTEKFDVYRFAIAALEIFCGKDYVPEISTSSLTWNQYDSYLLSSMLADKVPCVSSAKIVTLIADCLQQEPDKRPNFESVTNILSNELNFVRTEIKRLHISLVEQETQNSVFSVKPSQAFLERSMSDASVSSTDSELNNIDFEPLLKTSGGNTDKFKKQINVARARDSWTKPFCRKHDQFYEKPLFRKNENVPALGKYKNHLNKRRHFDMFKSDSNELGSSLDNLKSPKSRRDSKKSESLASDKTEKNSISSSTAKVDEIGRGVKKQTSKFKSPNTYSMELERQKQRIVKLLGTSSTCLQEKDIKDGIQKVRDPENGLIGCLYSNMIQEGLRKVRGRLVEYLDPENGLIRSLFLKGVLTESEHNRLNAARCDKTMNYIELNEMLLDNYIYPKIETCCKKFVEALQENQQQHVAKFITNAGVEVEANDRVLSKKEIDTINNHMFNLVKLIDSHRIEFLYRLVSKDCITNRQKENVEKWPEVQKKIDELLTILKRRSYRDFCNFKLCIRVTMLIRDRMSDILTECGVVSARRLLLNRKDKKLIELQIINIITGQSSESNEIDSSLSPEQVEIITAILKKLDSVDVRVFGNSAWMNVVRDHRPASVSEIASNRKRKLGADASDNSSQSKKGPAHTTGIQDVILDKNNVQEVINRYNGEFDSPVVAAWFEGFDGIQIFIAPDGCKSRSMEEHRTYLTKEIKGYKLKVDQWEEIPVYKSTNKISPGGMVKNSTFCSTLGLFLEADGRKCALTTGHDRAFGDEILSRQTLNGAVFEQVFGKVNLKIEEGNYFTPFCDVAVIDIIDEEVPLSNHVITSNNYCLHLNPIAEELYFEQVQDVQLFVNGDVRKQRVKFVRGNFCVESLKHLNGCVQIESKTGHPIQRAGESGILITTTVDDDSPHIVNGLAVLTGILGNLSIGQPLKRTIDRIKSCENFKDIRIAGVRNYCGTLEQ